MKERDGEGKGGMRMEMNQRVDMRGGKSARKEEAGRGSWTVARKKEKT